MAMRIKRLSVVGSLVAVAGFVRAASADSPVYADINGMCGGKTPCYLTIQDAVNGATDPDAAGPLFAEIYVFPGTYNENVNLSTMGGSVQGDLQITTVDSAGAPAPGTVTIDPGGGSAIGYDGSLLDGRVTIDGFVVTSDDSSAILFASEKDITIRNVEAHSAGLFSFQDPNNPVGTGIVVYSHEGDVTVFDSVARNCVVSGVYAESGDGNVTIEGVDANDNGQSGIYADAEKGLLVLDSSTRDNGSFGMYLYASNAIRVDGCRFEQNSDGISVNAGNEATVFSSTAIGNRDTGFNVLTGVGSVTLDRLTADGNKKNGIVVLESREVIVTNSTCTRSALTGFYLEALEHITLGSAFSRDCGRGFRLYTHGDVQVTHAAAERMATHGFLVTAGGSVVMDRITALGVGVQFEGTGVHVQGIPAISMVENLSIRNSLIADNAEFGILLEELAPGGSHVIAGSMICNKNDGAIGVGQSADSKGVIDARGNWWGDVTGPKRPNSAAGLGDGIEPGGGEILVDPWIDQITAVASHETATLANDVTVQFQFRHSGSETYLGEGPGAAGARRPFTVTSDNGTVRSHDQNASAVTAFVGGDEGIVEVVAKGAAEGPAKIELSGLCFPARSVTIEVIPVPIPLPPNPTPVAGANPTPPTGSDPVAGTKRGSPLCGAGVSAMAALSAVGLFATRVSVGPRRRSRGA